MAVQIFILLMLTMGVPVVQSFSIDRLMLKALEVNDTDGLEGKTVPISWNDYKVEGFNETMVRLQIDMIMTLDEAKEAYPRRSFSGRWKRSAVHDESKLWPRRIPYTIHETFSAEDKLKIHGAMQQWMQFTCLEFVPGQPRDFSIIRFENDKTKGCSSLVGNYHMPQPINLATGCVHLNVIIHEIGHAIGLYHEHSRPDRDDFITIEYDNMEDIDKKNFDKSNWAVHKNYSKPYDYLSIMHYSKNFYAKKAGLLTIVPKDPEYTDIIGKGKTISFQDARIVNAMYKCSEGCKSKVCPSDGFLGKNCECYCPREEDEVGEPVKLCTQQVYCGKPDIDETVYMVLMLLNSELKEIQTLNKDFSNGTVIEIEFREFSICGADYSEWICMEGEWIGHLPQCESDPCSLPEIWMPEDEYMAKDGVVLHGTNLSVHCTTGKVETAVLNCYNGTLNDLQSNKPFDTESLGCTESALYRIIRDDGRSCPVVYDKDVRYSIIQDFQRLDEGYNVRHMTKVTAECDDHDIKGEFRPEDLSKSMQCKDGKWEGIPPVSCPAVRKPCSLVTNAVVSGPLNNSATDKRVFDHFFQVKCLRGYSPSRKRKYQCTFDGVWKPEVPACEPQSCRIPQNYPSQLFTTDGMNLIGGMKVAHGRTIRLVCGWGEASDVDKVSCSLGMWQTKSSQLPVCEKVVCHVKKNHPVSGIRFKHKPEYVYGDTISKKSCPRNLELQGLSSVTCQRNGTWSGTISCKEFCHDGTRQYKILKKKKMTTEPRKTKRFGSPDPQTCMDLCTSEKRFPCTGVSYGIGRNGFICNLYSKHVTDSSLTYDLWWKTADRVCT